MRDYVLYFILIFLFPAFLVCQEADSINYEQARTMTLQDLMAVKIISAEKKEQSVIDIPASVVIITRNDIEELGFGSYKEILNHITGLYVIDDNYWLGSVNYGVRGFYKNGPFSNMVILVDGISQLSDKYSDYPDVKITVPVESIERIEVIRGPMAVMYGNGAFFGVINIITYPDKTKKLKNQVAIAYGSNDNRKAFTEFGGQIEDLTYSAIGSFIHTDGLDVPYTDLTSNINIIKYAGLDSNATTKNHLSEDRIYTGISAKYKDLSVKLNYNHSKKGVFDGGPAYGNGNKLTTNAVNFNIEYSKKFSDKLSARANFGYYYHSHTLNYEIFRKHYYEVDYQHTNAYDFELDLFYNPSEIIEFNTGFYHRTTYELLQLSDYGYYGLDNGDGKVGLPEGETLSNTAIYEQITVKPIPQLRIIGGIRFQHLSSYDMYYSRGVVSEDSADNRLPSDPTNRVIIEQEYQPEENGYSIIPRIAAIYEFIPNNYLKVMYSEASNHPSVTENYRQLPQDRPQLKSSKIQSFEVNYLTNSLDYLIVNASLFWNNLDALIKATNVYNSSSGEWEIYSANSAKLETFGSELSLKINPTKSISINLSGIYQETKNKEDGYTNIEVPYSPKLLLYGNIIYRPTNKIALSVLYKYTDKMETEWETDDVPENGERIGLSMPAYSTFDFNFRLKSVLIKNSYLNLKIRNLLNTEIRYPTTNANSWVDKGYISNYQKFALNLGYKF